MNKVVTIMSDGRCNCDASTPCPQGRTGTMSRCTREELQFRGVPTRNWTKTRGDVESQLEPMETNLVPHSAGKPLPPLWRDLPFCQTGTFERPVTKAVVRRNGGDVNIIYRGSDGIVRTLALNGAAHVLTPTWNHDDQIVATASIVEPKP